MSWFQGETSPCLDLLFSPHEDRMKEEHTHSLRDYFTSVAAPAVVVLDVLQTVVCM